MRALRAWVLTVTGALAGASLLPQCASHSTGTEREAPALSEFTQRLMQRERAPASLPAAPPRAGGARGVWSVRPQAHGCSPALLALVRLGDAESGLRCGGFQSCVASIINGMQSVGISRGSARLIRIDAVAAPAPQRMNGLRLRFEERAQDGDGPITYTAHILLFPDEDATTAGVLITKDVGESYECFDAAYRALAQFVDGFGG